jgi:hypothetical protein
MIFDAVMVFDKSLSRDIFLVDTLTEARRRIYPLLKS